MTERSYSLEKQVGNALDQRMARKQRIAAMSPEAGAALRSKKRKENIGVAVVWSAAILAANGLLAADHHLEKKAENSQVPLTQPAPDKSSSEGHISHRVVLPSR